MRHRTDNVFMGQFDRRTSLYRIPLLNGSEDPLSAASLIEGGAGIAALLTNPLDQFLGVDLELDESSYYRALAPLGFGFMRTLFQYGLHELGHSFVAYAFKGEGQLAWDTTFTVPLGIPRPIFTGAYDVRLPSDLDALKSGEGFNFQGFMNQITSKRSLNSGQIQPVDALDYLLSSLFVFTYIVGVPDNKLEQSTEYKAVFDPNGFRHNLNEQGIHLSYAEHSAWSAFAFLFNARNWDYAHALYQYWSEGERVAPLSLRTGGFEFYLPETQLWHHPQGLLLEHRISFKRRDIAYEATLDITHPIAGESNLVRIGVEGHFDHLGSSRYSPSLEWGFYFTHKWQGEDVEGFLFQLASNIPVYANDRFRMGISVFFQVLQNDAIETDLKLVGDSRTKIKNYFTTGDGLEGTSNLLVTNLRTAIFFEL